MGPISLTDDAALAAVVCAATFHAGPRVAHGGWTAAVFDDVMGRSLGQRGIPAVTATLTTDFLKPVPVEEPLAIAVSIDAQEGRRWMLSATLTLAGDATPLARAHGVWVERRSDHFERHEAGLKAHRAARDTAAD
ncbi:PaaI family thioesterase [Sphingomonas sp. A2-49]|uniref:PaaI family thioesterase n=1 Tax=Sphingomonas sp. A2-49 TaxID=1391375 RepID=UPI0021D3DC3C|nr:PaaI family thioesterase [Sphingomonas sp. A2-49]MCU6453146.1 PaaI family thioesterase [Sphingomonas sp. A2-49]